MKYAFVTGMGRSGTKFLASLLQRCPGIDAEHESIGDRRFWLLSWYLADSDYARSYLAAWKQQHRAAASLYIDVNGLLHHAVPALRTVFSEAPIFHLVRDPRRSVRSLFLRRHIADMPVMPKGGPALSRWMEEDKLFQVCWNWADTTMRLLDQDTRLLRFEGLVADYAYLKRGLLDPLQTTLAEPAWRSACRHRVNETRPAWYRRAYAVARGKRFVADTLAPFESWPAERQHMLLDVCGEAMRRCGYAVEGAEAGSSTA